jgi:glutaredoxin
MSYAGTDGRNGGDSMSDELLIGQLTDLFRETGNAYREAITQTKENDSEWALWYADHLHERLSVVLAAPVTRSRLVFCLVATHDEHRTIDPDSPWQEFYARRILECLGPAEAPERDSLTLYHFEGCPFCTRVRNVIDELGIDVELRDIFADRQYLAELRDARGRRTVPVLRITNPDGEDRWMPESADIVRYLRATYGKEAA